MSLDVSKYEDLSDAQIVALAERAAAPLEKRIKAFLAVTDPEHLDRDWTHDASFICVMLMTLRQAADRIRDKKTQEVEPVDDLWPYRFLPF